jgi:hypothetical protein
MSDHLFALRLFTRVARKRSFSAAGRELNIPQSTASRTMAMLEREIGVALFVRTTRTVTLTDAGLDFLPRIEPVLAELEEAETCCARDGRVTRNIADWSANEFCRPRGHSPASGLHGPASGAAHRFNDARSRAGATIRGLCQVFVSPITAMAIMVTA